MMTFWLQSENVEFISYKSHPPKDTQDSQLGEHFKNIYIF